MKIVVVGGGYAGLACLIELRRRISEAELVLVDPALQHLKLTHLHETVRRPLSDFLLSYEKLGERIGFRHCQGAIAQMDLAAIAKDSSITIDNHTENFDYLVITTGGAAPRLPKADHVYDRDDLRHQDASQIIKEFIDDDSRSRNVTVIGAGPSGVQFLFELSALFSAKRHKVRLSLVDRDAGLLEQYPARLGEYVAKKLVDSGIEYLPQTEYRAGSDSNIELHNLVTGEKNVVSSGLSFLFPGVSPTPFAIETDRYGRARGYDNIFSAGDCAQFDSRGDDALTAQVAVRQGKLVAQNIDRYSRNVRPLEYFFRELGYVVSLGPLDAVGWLLFKDRVVHGLPAFAIKEVVEAQYDLLVAGLDTYVL